MSGDFHESAACVALLSRALPVSSPETLLRQLADVWAQALHPSDAFVSFVQQRHFFGRLTNSNSSPSLRIPAVVNWSASAATAFAADCLAPDRVPHESPLIPFARDGHPLGGVIVFDSELSVNEWCQLADISAGVIAQLQQQHDAVTSVIHSQPELERRLRDLKLEALAEFAAGAGHEINNPVATIAGRAALLLKSETDPERRRALETIGGQAYRIRDMIGDAMTFARPPAPRRERLAAASEIRTVLDSLAVRRHASRCEITATLDEDLALHADREQFRVVVACLVRNSLEAVDEGGTIHISCQPYPQRESECARLTVSDNGPGLSPTAREHLFDPFFSGRSAGRGLGFGLSKCWRIVTLHGGWIDLDETQGGFTLHSAWPLAH